MRQHQAQTTTTKGGRPEWLQRAHDKARSEAWLASCGQRPDKITVEEKMQGGQVVALIAESRVDLTVPTALKDTLREVFIKANTELTIRDQTIWDIRLKSRVLVLVFKKPQNGIAGLPLNPAETRKRRKDGFTHVVITSVPKGAREEQIMEAQSRGRYDESGYWLGFYKPKGGHVREGDKGGDLVWGYQSELFVLQYLYENGLLALYDIPLLTSWGFLPKTDEQREEENAATAAIQMAFGRPDRKYHAGSSYHWNRLFYRFADIHQANVDTEAEMHERARRDLEETVIGKSTLRHVEAGTLESHTFYLSADNALGYAMHNGKDGQYVVKIDMNARTCEVGLTKRDLNGLEMMGLYDQFLTSEHFRQVSWQEFSAYTSGVGMMNLGTSVAT